MDKPTQTNTHHQNIVNPDLIVEDIPPEFDRHQLKGNNNGKEEHFNHQPSELNKLTLQNSRMRSNKMWKK